MWWTSKTICLKKKETSKKMFFYVAGHRTFAMHTDLKLEHAEEDKRGESESNGGGGGIIASFCWKAPKASASWLSDKGSVKVETLDGLVVVACDEGGRNVSIF
jgi:hypothetical protein